MLTLLPLDAGTKSGPWTFIPMTLGLDVENGDVICIGHAHPEQVKTASAAGAGGFIISGWGGHKYASIIDQIQHHHGVKVKFVSLWRKLPAKKEYTPSAWATPVPLP